ncbi:MAG: thermonuclease family protein [Xenococcaceae cyanobacterium]
MSWLKVLTKTLILAGLGAILIETSEKGQIKGEAHVIKGNIIEIDRQQIKLYGIDAPELEQICYVNDRPWQCGLTVKQKLVEKIEGKSLTCLTREQKNDNVPIAECFLGRQNLNGWLVEEGWAIADRQNSRSFISHEILAQRDHKGIYQSEFLKPSLWREINPPELTLNNDETILNH